MTMTKLCDAMSEVRRISAINLADEVTSRKLIEVFGRKTRMIRTETVPGTRRPVSAVLGYGLAVALVAAALGLTFLLQSFVSTAGFIFFYIAVVASSWFVGKWPGGLAVVLSGLAVAYFFTPPLRSFAVDRASLPVFIEFAASSLIVSWFSSWRRQAEAALPRRPSKPVNPSPCLMFRPTLGFKFHGMDSAS